MYSTTNKLFYFCKNSRNIFFIIFLILIQGCTSSIEVAANLGKKYLSSKRRKKIEYKNQFIKLVKNIM